MNTKHATIHPQLRAAARWALPFHVGPRTRWLLRAALHLMRGTWVAEGVAVEDVHIASGQGRRKLRARVYRPASTSGSLGGLLWLHGGGHIMGNPEMDDASCAAYARESKLVVVSVDYRLSPRHRFPNALDDAYDTLTWLHAHAVELGVDPARIAVGGASAGGGLAAALAQLAHDRDQIELAFQLLIYPMLDDRTTRPVGAFDSEPIVWSRKSNRYAWKCYLGPQYALDAPAEYAAPARRVDLRGLPPAWIGVGSADLFHDEAVAYAQRLRECGVPCELSVIPGAFHGFDVIAPKAPIVAEFRAAQLTALQKELAAHRVRSAEQHPTPRRFR